MVGSLDCGENCAQTCGESLDDMASDVSYAGIPAQCGVQHKGLTTCPGVFSHLVRLLR